MILSSIFAFIGSATSGLTFNIKGRKLLFAGFSGLIGFAVYSLMLYLTSHNIFAIFFGAVAVGIYSEATARIIKSPATTFSIPGILPLVPGIAAYEMMQSIMSNELIKAIGKMIETSSGAGAIAFGIMLITAVFRFVSRARKRRIMKMTMK